MNRRAFGFLPLLLFSIPPLLNSVGHVPGFRIVALYGSGVCAGAVLASFVFSLRSKHEP
jgi:hypothetical protein